MSFVNKSDHLDAVASGSYTTVAASDSVTTGLREVLYVMAQLGSDPVLAVDRATVAIANQVTSPGVITIKTWKPTGTTDATPVAATTFSKVVHWLAFGR